MSTKNSDKLNGNLNTLALPVILVSLQNQKATGSLDINSKFEISIYFDQGYPYFAAGGSGETLLGKILLNRSKITKYQYDKAGEEIKKDNTKRIGEILVKLGMITPHELNHYLELQLREKILESFLYLEGNYEFKPSDNVDQGLFYARTSTPELINEAFQRYVFSTEVDFDTFDFDYKGDLKGVTSDLGFGPKELRLVQLLDQKKSLKDIEKSEQFKKDEILRVILQLGLYELVQLKNLSVNDYVLELFKRYTDMNPLPAQIKSNYTVKESELTDPTGEVLLLDDELEATAERERLEVESSNKNQRSIEEEVPSVETVSVDAEIQEPEHKEPPSGKDEPVEAEDVEADEEFSVREHEENFEFQDKYEGSQKAIEIEEDADNYDSNLKEDEEEIKINLDDLEAGAPETDSSSDDGEEEKPVQFDQESDHSEKDIQDFYNYLENEEDYYRILRVKREATYEEIKETYFKLIKKFHPDANTQFPEEIKNKAEKIFTKVTKAYEILSDEQQRREFDSSEELNKLKDKANSIYEAELIYTEAEMLIRQRNYKEAEKKLLQAIELNPDESAYIGIYAWAKYLAAQNKEKVIEDVKKELNRAIEMDSTISENYYYLGMIYKYTDNLSRAEKNFANAVRYDRNYIEAKRELRLLKSRRENKVTVKEPGKKFEKKFWSGLFKK